MYQAMRPIVLEPYHPAWPDLFHAEREHIMACSREWVLGVEHIGSTAVPGLSAKPVVDIMVAVSDAASALACIEPLQTVGYTVVPEYRNMLPDRFDFYYKDKDHARVAQIHMTCWQSGFWEKHLLFRDYLRAHPEVAQAYEALKHELARQYSPDVNAYAGAKTEFIEAILQQARSGQHP